MSEVEVGTPRSGSKILNGASLSSVTRGAIPALSNLVREVLEMLFNCRSTWEIKYERSAALAAKSEAIIARLVKTTEAKISRLRSDQSESGVRTRLNAEFI